MKLLIQESSKHDRVLNPNYIGCITETDRLGIAHCVQFFNRKDGKITAKYFKNEKHTAFDELPETSRLNIMDKTKQKGWIPETV